MFTYTMPLVDVSDLVQSGTIVPVVAEEELAHKGLGCVLVYLLLRRVDVEDTVKSASDLIDVAAFVAEEQRSPVHHRRAEDQER